MTCKGGLVHVCCHCFRGKSSNAFPFFPKALVLPVFITLFSSLISSLDFLLFNFDKYLLFQTLVHTKYNASQDPPSWSISLESRENYLPVFKSPPSCSSGNQNGEMCGKHQSTTFTNYLQLLGCGSVLCSCLLCKGFQTQCFWCTFLP